MSQTAEQFPLSQLDHKKYNFKDPDSLQAVCRLAKSFVKWLSETPNDAGDRDATKAKVRAFIKVITANGDPRIAGGTFKQVSFHVPELRSDKDVTDPRSALDYLLQMTQSYRPQAREEVPQETVYFARSVARQMESFELTQRRSGTEDEILAAVLNSLSVPEELGSPSTAQQTLVARRTPRSGHSKQGAGSPGTRSPKAGSSGAQQIQSKAHGQHTRTPSGTGTSGRREEAESGSLQDLRARRQTVGSAPASSPLTSLSGLAEGMSGLTVHHGFSAGTSATYGPPSGRATAAYRNVPEVSTFSPEQLAGARHTGILPDSPSPSIHRGRSISTQASAAAFGPSAYTTQRREPSQTRGQPSQVQGSVERGRSPNVPGSGYLSTSRTSSTARPPPSAMPTSMSVFQSAPSPRERGRSEIRQPNQPPTRDASTGSAGSSRMFAPRPVGEISQQSTNVSQLRSPPNPSSSRQSATLFSPQPAAPRSQSAFQQPVPSVRSSSQQPGSRGIPNVGAPPQSGYQQIATTSSRAPNMQQDRGRAQSRPPSAAPPGLTSSGRTPSVGQGRQSSIAPSNRAPSTGQGRQSSTGPGNRAPSAGHGRTSSVAPPPKKQSGIEGFFTKKDSSK